MKSNKAKWWVGGLAVFIGVISLASQAPDSSENTFQPASVNQAVESESVQLPIPIPTVNNVSQVKTETNNLSNDNYYQNSVGNTVHSPAYSLDNSVPAGASAQCRDGTYSFSQNRRGTCSHHGGVAKWLY